MADIKVMIWLFPILFIFHDFEEIILMNAWINKNSSYVCEKFPKLSKQLYPKVQKINQEKGYL